jgi:hypothetical protein
LLFFFDQCSRRKVIEYLKKGAIFIEKGAVQKHHPISLWVLDRAQLLERV